MLLDSDTEHTLLPGPRASRSLLSQRWMGPVKVLARTAPITYLLDVLATCRTCAEFNIELLRPYLRRRDHLGGEAAPPPPVVGADGRPEQCGSMLCRSCSSSRCAEAGPTSCFAGWGTMCRATHGSRSKT